MKFVVGSMFLAACLAILGIAMLIRRSTQKRAKEPFVIPLGVVPLSNGKQFDISYLHNGFVKEEYDDPRFGAKCPMYRISLSTDKIETFVHAFVERILPEKVFAILDYSDVKRIGKDNSERSFLTPFLPKNELTRALKPYMFRLVNDGFVGFGYGWYDHSSHHEIFVKAKKIILIRSSKVAEIEQLLREAGIDEFREPRFITDFETLNGDLASLAGISRLPEISPYDYSQFKSREFMSSVYVPELMERLGFKENQ